MGAFVWGLAAGALAMLAVAGGVGYVAYGRYERLSRRARRAERLAELGTLTGGLAHEIKNPLSTVQLNLQLLREDVSPDGVDGPAAGRLLARLGTVQKETARLRDILDDFLRYAGNLELDRKPTDVNLLLEDLGDFFSPQAQFQRVQLRVRPADRPLVVPLDERLMKQAVLNLMINALQAMPDGGGEVLLSADRDAAAGEAVVRVTDTGRGIPPDVRDHIFEAYYSTKKGGTGLGLAITKRVVDEHGGRIAVESEVGKGTAFTIRLPVR